MRKINESDYTEFMFESAAFTLRGTYKTVYETYAAYNGRATLYGRKPYGTLAILDSKF